MKGDRVKRRRKKLSKLSNQYDHELAQILNPVLEIPKKESKKSVLLLFQHGSTYSDRIEE